MDNGPELTANSLRDWCRFSGSGSVYIEPGSPWENPFIESFNGKLRDELPNVEAFETLLEAQVLAEDFRIIEYNTYRPHSSLGGLTPFEFAEQWRKTNPDSQSWWITNRGQATSPRVLSPRLLVIAEASGVVRLRQLETSASLARTVSVSLAATVGESVVQLSVTNKLMTAANATTDPICAEAQTRRRSG